MSKPSAVGAYIFAGGFTQGIKKHLEVREHLEDGNYGVRTSLANHPGLEVFTDPGEWTSPEFWDSRPRPAVIFANPPCAPWSSAGSKVRGARRDYSAGFDPRDARVSCFANVHQLMCLIRPRVAVVESVVRAWTAGRPFIEGLAAESRELGYGLDVILHDGHDCGVAQRRRRVLFAFTAAEIDWRKPALPGPRTVREAWEAAGLWPEDPEPEFMPSSRTEIEALGRTAYGGKLSRAFDEIYGDSTYDQAKGKRIGRPGFLCRRLDPDRASWTHTGSASLYHPELPRRCSVREAQVLCGYPVDYIFDAPTTMKYKQMAQAVMPPVGEWIGATLAEALDSGRSRTDADLRVIDLR